MVGKSSQKYLVNARVPQGTIVATTFFPLDLSDNIICNITMYANDTTLSTKFDQASDLLQQLELASELESDLRDTVDQGRRWHVDVIAGKSQLVLVEQSNNHCTVDVKMDGCVLEEKSLFNIQELTFSSELDRGFFKK